MPRARHCFFCLHGLSEVNGVQAMSAFPGVITVGATEQEARRLLASALVGMAETNLLMGEPLPRPDPDRTDPISDLHRRRGQRPTPNENPADRLFLNRQGDERSRAFSVGLHADQLS